MKIFDKFKKKNEPIVQVKVEVSKEDTNEKNLSITAMSNYMLADVRKDNLSNNCYSLSLSKLQESSPITIPVINTIKEIVEHGSKSSDKLYRVTNLLENDSLKAMKDGKTFWGAIKRSDGTSAMAKLSEVNSNGIMAIDPTVLMMSVVLSNIEKELAEIKELNKKILSFLEEEKEAEIESDLEILNRLIIEFKYNLGDEKYLINNYKQVMDVKRTANKNMLFYKKQIRDELSKDKLFTTSNGMNSIINEIEKKFKYYRLSLYIYSFSSLMEVIFLGNCQEDFLLTKKSDLEKLDSEYLNEFNNALRYIKDNANKSLEGNVLSGLGSAGKIVGNLASMAKAKNVNTWLNEKSDDLKQTGQSIKDNFAIRFESIRESNSKPFIKQLENIDSIYNKTKEIYFDGEKVYLEMK